MVSALGKGRGNEQGTAGQQRRSKGLESGHLASIRLWR